METGIIVFVINILTSFLKRFIYPKFGKAGIQVTVFVLALIGAGYGTFKNSFPGLETYVVQGIAILALAIANYELILSHIPLFKGKKIDTKIK